MKFVHCNPMKQLLILFTFFSISCFSQEEISTELIETKTLNADKLVSIDNFEATYFIKNNAIKKATVNDTLNYSNFQLGQISSANAFNPLKINLFYSDFNTVIILDNRLAEVAKIDFNSTENYKNITHVTTGFDNTIWIYNQDFQYLELYDYQTKKTRYKTIPVSSKVLDLTSNYNYCWLLTENFLYCYNYFGSVVYKLPNSGFTNLQATKENLIIKGKDGLIYYSSKDQTQKAIKTSNMLINQFFVTNQILYIYTLKTLSKFQLKTD